MTLYAFVLTVKYAKEYWVYEVHVACLYVPSPNNPNRSIADLSRTLVMSKYHGK